MISLAVKSREEDADEEYGPQFPPVKYGYRVLSLPRKRAANLDPQRLLFDTFSDLRNVWKAETSVLSSITEIVAHPAYLQIIGLGAIVLPYVFDELRNEPDHWFVALEAITRENPVVEEHLGDIDAMAGDWLEWAGQPRFAFVGA